MALKVFLVDGLEGLFRVHVGGITDLLICVPAQQLGLRREHVVRRRFQALHQLEHLYFDWL
jgi:hypothetical protein